MSVRRDVFDVAARDGGVKQPSAAGTHERRPIAALGVLPRSALRWMRCVAHSGPAGSWFGAVRCRPHAHAQVQRVALDCARVQR